MVRGEVSGGQVIGLARLIVQAIVGLPRVTDRQLMIGIKAMINASVVSPFEKGSRNHSCGVGADGRQQAQFRERLLRHDKRSVLAVAFDGAEEKVLIFANWSADVSAELLALELGRWLVALFGKIVVGIERRLRVVEISPAMEFVRSRFGDHVDGCAFA